MYSHIPQKLTLAGTVSPVLHDGLGIALYSKTSPKIPYVWRTAADFCEHARTARTIDPADPSPIAGTHPTGQDEGAPHAIPPVLRQGVDFILLSSCSNAVFMVPRRLYFPLNTVLAVHCQCTLVTNQVLGGKLDLLTCYTYTLADEDSPAIHTATLSERTLPCYRIDSFRVGLPPLDTFGAGFAFSHVSNLDAFAIVAHAANPHRATSSSSSSSSNAAAAPAPLLPSWRNAVPEAIIKHGDLLPLRIEGSQPAPSTELPFLEMDKLWDLAETMGLDGRYMNEAGLRGLAARRTLASQFLGELIVLQSAHRYGEASHLALRIVSGIMYWNFMVRGVDHPLCRADTTGSLRAALGDLAESFWPSAWSEHENAFIFKRLVRPWREFLSHCAVSRFIYPWLDARATTVPSLELQQILVDVFTGIAREMIPETFEKLYAYCVRDPGAATDAETKQVVMDIEQFAGDVRFGFHKSALKLYLDKLVDRTRYRPTRRERAARMEDIRTGMQTRLEQQQQESSSDILDIDDLVPDVENPASDTPARNDAAGATGDDEPVHDESYYARRGAHGNGHLYLKAVATDAPFGDGGGRMWKWCAREAGNELAPIVIDQDPTGKANLNLRVMAYHDFMALQQLQQRFNAMSSFYTQRDALREKVTANRAKVFTDVSTIALSDGSQLKLSDEQMALFDRITDGPVTVIKGGGGTGKSTLIAALLTVFSGSVARPAEQQVKAPKKADSDNEDDFAVEYRAARGNETQRSPFIEWLHETPVALLMAYGKVASNFMRKFGMFASTVHLAAAHLNGDFYHDDRLVAPPTPSTAQARIVIVDEITVQSLTHMTMIFNAFPSICKLIVVGDINQMSCIERGAVGDAIVRLSEEFGSMSVRLSHNYRLTNQSGDDTQLEARTHIAFNAIINGSVTSDPRAFGPYSDKGRAADLPAICELSSWDPALVKRALARAPILLLPHVDLSKGALGSLKATCDALLKVVGTRPADWDSVQVLSQRRREEVGPITAHLSEALFGKALPRTRQGYLPPSDICPGEKVVFKRRVKALAPNGSPCFIYTNDMRIVERIEDADEVVLNGRDKRKRQTVYRNQVTRPSTRAYVPSAPTHPKRVRIITFKDGYRVVVPYTSPVAYQSIDFLRRGLCVTNASMQGSAAETVVTYIRPEVSHTLDRRQMYTSVSRMEKNCIIIGSRDTLEKVVRQAPQVRNDHTDEFLRPTFQKWHDICEVCADHASLFD